MQKGGVLYVSVTTLMTAMMTEEAILKWFCKFVATCAMEQQATTAIAALTAGSVANLKFSSMVKGR